MDDLREMMPDLVCVECGGTGELLGSRTYNVCAKCHGSGIEGVIGEYQPGTHWIKKERYAAIMRGEGNG